MSEECEHTIGENNSTETIEWQGRNPFPVEHYVRYRCEKCGVKVHQLLED